MRGTLLFLLCAVLLLCSCGSATPISIERPTPVPTEQPTYEPTPLPSPTPTVTPTVTPTATPEAKEVQGVFFLDANGSGLMDKASFICPESNRTPPSLEHFFPGVCSDRAGQLVTVIEPGLAGLTVCKGEACATTGADGAYSLLLTGYEDGRRVNLKVADPNADDPARAMRYLNIWNGTVVVGEQNLNDTTVRRLGDGFYAEVGGDNQVGLMQGVLTLPFSAASISCLEMQWYDWDFSKGAVINWFGSTAQSYLGGPDGKTYDGHRGEDYFCDLGTAMLATAPGTSDFWGGSDNTSLNLGIDHTVSEDNGLFMSVYGHLKESLVDKGVSLYRGQLVALSGASGTQIAHLHLDCLTGKGYSAPEDDFIGAPTSFQRDPYAIMLPAGASAPTSLQKVSPYSMWTVYNLPVFPETK